ncbi:hypothetical protein TraAM80_05535 [Trypanosoma rangeli]|uniref:REH2 DRSM domain-containing protein n=1 Tax=Trypanosoma rangeli TaxID=5698 RepID=A0A422NEG0_TRYRA|nr:uncharacterized protein TraAM80_05535 [Trypanosoma rangeli]RNF03839.1 hypothetical protein TraAM80_05535 [Trypanosoma rangeli]|eukprot:RNF03839.1 hypothetical protein TraAM80_05535 [Trypanosoma rangeli]
MRLRLSAASGRLSRTPLCHALWWGGCQAMCMTKPTRSLLRAPSEAPEVLQVELLVPDDVTAGSNNNRNTYSNGDGDDADDFAELEENEASKDAAAETVTTVDAFARAKVANFVKRMLSSASAKSSQSAAAAGSLLTEVREVQTTGDEEALFHARVRVPLPPEYGERWGEGLAPTEKEAELVAAMHAERVIDAMGLPMFQLTSKQKRHAEAARNAGRWAPMPGDSPRPPTTPSPPRLQLLREGAMKAAERQLQIDKMTFSNVTVGSFTPMKLTLASPFFLDYGSVYRVKEFFAAYNCNIQRYSRVTPLHKCNVKDKPVVGGEAMAPTSDGADDSNKMFVAQIKLPIDGRFGERIACGKSPTKKEAIALACMHAELIIDALGLALYPSNREKQETHAEECRKVNRWCSRPSDCEYHYTKSSPPPLQLFKEGVLTTATEVDSVASVESVLISHAKAIEGFTNVTEVRKLEPASRRDFLNYLAQHQNGSIGVRAPFFVESLGIKDHEVYRATATVPVPLLAAKTPPAGSMNVHGNEDADLVSFVAIGIGTSEMEAETAASMHALSVLKLLNRPLLGDTSTECEGLPQHNLTRDTIIPAPYRYVVGHIGRIMVPGLSPGRSIGVPPSTARQRGPSAESREERLRSVRAGLPKSDWSLDADADGYIILSPSMNVQEGRNYVHTLPSVRQADRFALVRLRDYMERHGKRLESAVKTCMLETDEGLTRWVKKVILPVPEVFGQAVAHGEAYAEEEALVMCAVHAELVLDNLGVALYDHNLLQVKHCDAAGLLGRWVPYETQSAQRAVPTPPPIRKEHVDSCLWARLSKEARRESPVLCGEGLKPITPTVPLVREDNTAASEKTPTATAATGPTTTASSASSGVTDDALCDLAGLVSVHPSEFFRHAPRLLEGYCKRKGVDIYRCVRQYNVYNPCYGLVHRAIMELPVPAQFGRRHAVGCAASKKEALLLCCMHAVYILGELGVPIYIGSKQAEYAAIAKSKGRYAPKPGDPLRSADTKSPPGLKSLQDMHMEKPLVPRPPSFTECHKSFVWSSYVTACRGYIQKMKEHVVLDALFIQGKAPRNGVVIEDNGLDVIEGLPLFANAKSKLVQKCAAARLPAPPPMAFRFEVYGRHPHRRYLVEQPVLGTPFVARGMGEEGQGAVTRAAMHYEYIVGIISDPLLGSAETGNMLRNRHGDLFDPVLRDFTPRGKLAIMALYTTLRDPFLPLRLTLKERNSSAAGNQLVYVSLVEVEDESGLRMAGKGEDRTNVEESRNRAIAELYKQLQRKSTFQAVAQLLQTYPALRAEGAAQILVEKKSMAGLRLMLAGRDALPAAALTTPPPLELSEWGGVATLLRGGEAHLDSPELQLLCTLVERALGSASTPIPLNLPAAPQHLLRTMGFLSTCGTGEGNGTPQANTMGVAVTLLASCLPPLSPVHVHGEFLPLTSGALPLQLAKLLFAGLLLDSLHVCVRVAALVLSSFIIDGDSCRGGDVVELVPLELPQSAKRLATDIAARLYGLSSQLRKLTSPSCTLTALMDASRVVADGGWGSLQEGWTIKEEARLRLAVSFATFPRAFIQRKVATDDVLRLITVESKDRQRTARIAVPSTLAVVGNLSSDIAASSTSSSSSVASSLSSCHSFFPCFCAFDGASTGEGEELSLLGTFVPPCGLLLASASCDEPRAVVVADDVPNIAIVDGFLPVVMRSAESLAALVELRLTLRCHWAALTPLLADIQDIVDKLLVAKHSLAHILRAKLLD